MLSSRETGSRKDGPTLRHPESEAGTAFANPAPPSPNPPLKGRIRVDADPASVSHFR
jgi:hypothetical protein